MPHIKRQRLRIDEKSRSKCRLPRRDIPSRDRQGAETSVGTRDQLIKDLQRVHKVFPTAQPDRDFYRVHGKYADAAWKEHFPRFKDFVATARPTLTPFAAACRYLEQAARVLNQPAGQTLTEQEILELHDVAAKVGWLRPALESSREKVVATLGLNNQSETD